MTEEQELTRIAISELDELKATDFTKDTLVLVSPPSENGENRKFISKKSTTETLSNYIIGKDCKNLDSGLGLRFLKNGYYSTTTDPKSISCHQGFFITSLTFNENGVPTTFTLSTVGFTPSNYGGGLLSSAIDLADSFDLTGTTYEYTVLSDGWVVFNGEIIEDSSEKAYTELLVSGHKIALWNNIGVFDGIKANNYSSSGMPLAVGTKVTFKRSDNGIFQSGSKINVTYFKLNGVYQEKSLNNYVLKSDAVVEDSAVDDQYVTHVVEKDGIIKAFKSSFPSQFYIDTKNTTSTVEKTNSKLIIVGSESQQDAAITNTNGSCYIGTDNCIYSNNQKVITENDDNVVARTGKYEDLKDKPDSFTRQQIVDLIYPVGSIYLSLSPTVVPDNIFGGTWARIAAGKCLWGAMNNSEVGTTRTSGLPNITGSFWGGLHDVGYGYDGCFTMTGNNRDGNNWSDLNNPQVNFDASNSNSIYGNSDIVQPPAVVVNMWKRTS